jgi:hypothetical protein
MIAGSEFGDKEVHVLLISKALCGLKSSGLRWHKRFADVLRDLKFISSKAENDIWMHIQGDHCEHIKVHVDDLLIVSRDLQPITHELENTNKFCLKGTGSLTHHLGCNFFCNGDNTLHCARKKHINTMVESHAHIFGAKPKCATSPLAKNDHPETDQTAFLDPEPTKIHHSLVGSLQWVTQIRWLDIMPAIMTMSHFHIAPSAGHME